MEQYQIERLLSEAKEGEHLIRKLEPDFRLEELVSHNFEAFGDAGKHIGFSGKVRLTHYDLEQLQDNFGRASGTIEEFRNALDFYEDMCKIADRRLSLERGDAEDYKIFEESVKDFRLRYGRIVNWITGVDVDKVYGRILDMRDAVDYYKRNGIDEQKREAVSIIRFLDNVLEENKYTKNWLNTIYTGPVSIEAIARDSFMGETPKANIVFERKQQTEREKERTTQTTVSHKEEEMASTKIFDRYLAEKFKKTPESKGKKEELISVKIFNRYLKGLERKSRGFF